MPIRYSQPYRGQVRPKVYGQPAPPDPSHGAIEQIFWVVLAIAGVVTLYFAIKLAANRDFGGVFVFVLYLIFLLIMIFAFREAKQFKTITPDDDNDEQDHDRHSLAEDYFKQIEWKHTHHKGRHPSRWSVPEPKWRYHAITAKSSTKSFGLFVVLPVVAIILVLAYLYGANSIITVTVSIALGLIGFCVFLIVQNSKS